MQARHLAIEAAKEKGAIYAKEAGVSLGRMIHMQELANPGFMEMTQYRASYGMNPDRDTDSEMKTTLEPDESEVEAGVLVTFSMEH